MTYKKFLVVASKLDKAGINITTQLSQFDEKERPFDFYLVEKDVLHNDNLDLGKISEYDFVIFASKHRSEKPNKTLSVHVTGNWRDAKFGGEKGKVSRASAVFTKQIFEKLKTKAKEHKLNSYDVTLEATHHGPLIDKPSLFIEIGSSETEWKDRRAGFAVARTIIEAIKDYKENPYNEVVFAIGGPHYCPSFNKVQHSSNIAIAHVIPQYALPLEEEMVREALEKTEEEVDFALLDWKGLGNAESRQQVVDTLDKLYVRYEKVGSVGKESKEE